MNIKPNHNFGQMKPEYSYQEGLNVLPLGKDAASKETDNIKSSIDNTQVSLHKIFDHEQHSKSLSYCLTQSMIERCSFERRSFSSKLKIGEHEPKMHSF